MTGSERLEAAAKVLAWHLPDNFNGCALRCGDEGEEAAEHLAETVLAAVDAALLALINEAESRHGSSMYCQVTTYELRRALGMDVKNWPAPDAIIGGKQ